MSELLEEKLWAFVAPPNADGCRLWTGKTYGPGGYGMISLNGRAVSVHRVAYEAEKGPIPRGFVIDHFRLNPGPRNAPCSRACVEHLEAVPPRENVLRGVGLTATNARKTHCLRGHEFSADNTRVYTLRKTGTTGRSCRKCEGIRWLRKKAREAANV